MLCLEVKAKTVGPGFEAQGLGCAVLGIGLKLKT